MFTTLCEKWSNWLRQHPPITLLIIFLFHAANNFIVMALDRAPLVGDEAWLFEMSGMYLEILRTAGMKTLLLSTYGPDPPLHRIISMPFYVAFGYTPDIAILSTLPAMGVLIISVYHIGKNLQDKDTGLLAAALTVLIPAIFGSSRVYGQEFSLMAVVALSLALMLKTDRFSHRGYTFAFGISTGLGLLTKWSFTPFVIGPFLLYTFHAYRGVLHSSENPKVEWMRRCTWLLLSLFVGLLLASVWYVPHRDSVNINFKRYLIELEREGGWKRFNRENFLYFPDHLYASHLRPFFFIAALAALIHLLTRKHKGVSILCLWFIVPYLFLTFVIIQAKIPRYVFAYLPSFALLIAIGTMTLQPRLRRAVVVLLLTGGLVQFVALTYFGEPAPPLLKVDEEGLLHPDQRDWQIGGTVDVLNNLLANRPNPRVIIWNSYLYESIVPYFKRKGILPSFRYYSIGPCGGTDYDCEKTLPLSYWTSRTEAIGPCGRKGVGCGHTYEFYRELFINADVVLVGERESPGPDTLTPLSQQDSKIIAQAWESTSASFIALTCITLPPDGEHLRIYAKSRGEATEDEEVIPQGCDGVDAPWYYDNYSKSTILMIGPEEHLRFHLDEGAEPTELVLRYSAYRPEGFENPRFSVFINEILAAEVSEEPPYPWTLARMPMPEGLEHNGTLDVHLKSNTYVDDNGEERGIALDWFSVICGTESNCIKDWGIK